MTNMDQARAALGHALELEQEGYTFYMQAAEKVDDPTCKQTMLSLAEDEKLHEAMIVRQMEALSEDKSYVLLPNVEAVDADLSAEIFPPSIEQSDLHLDENADELQALNLAMEIEVRSYDLYRKAAQDTNDTYGQQMYVWLADAELQHFNLLMSNYEAINTRAKWV